MHFQSIEVVSYLKEIASEKPTPFQETLWATNGNRLFFSILKCQLSSCNGCNGHNCLVYSSYKLRMTYNIWENNFGL